jgi:uracil phosphoribosyltransferase
MQVIEISHPLKDHYLTIIRDKETDFENFREYSSKLSYLLFIEGTKNISTKVKPIETPLTSIDGLEIENENVAIAVLRAGLGLVDGVKNLLLHLDTSEFKEMKRQLLLSIITRIYQT